MWTNLNRDRKIFYVGHCLKLLNANADQGGLRQDGACLRRGCARHFVAIFPGETLKNFVENVNLNLISVLNSGASDIFAVNLLDLES